MFRPSPRFVSGISLYVALSHGPFAPASTIPAHHPPQSTRAATSKQNSWPRMELCTGLMMESSSKLSSKASAALLGLSKDSWEWDSLKLCISRALVGRRLEKDQCKKDLPSHSGLCLTRGSGRQPWKEGLNPSHTDSQKEDQTPWGRTWEVQQKAKPFNRLTSLLQLILKELGYLETTQNCWV